MAHHKYQNLEKKPSLVLKGKFGRSDATGPFKFLEGENIRAELTSRGVDTHSNKKELQERLTDLRGTSRVPSLLFRSQKQQLDELNLQDYEVLSFETFHIFLNHLAKILTELPLHMTDVDARLLFKEITNLALKKDKLRATDYRWAILKVTIALSYRNLPTEDEKDILLLTVRWWAFFMKMMGKEAPRSVLRLYNISFRHGQAAHPTKGINPTKAVWYLLPWCCWSCAIAVHAGLSPFHLCWAFWKVFWQDWGKTWKKHTEDLVPNAYLHIQAEDAVEAETNILTTLASQEKKSLVLQKVFLGQPEELMTKRSSLRQAHLSKISEFLKPGIEIW